MDRVAVTLYSFFLVSLSLGLIVYIVVAGSHAAQKTSWSGAASIFSILVAASGLLMWIGLTIVLATQREIGPHLPFLLFGPPIALALALAFSSDMRELIDAIPIDWAVGRAIQPARTIVSALFIAAVAPKVAIFAVGYRNRFRHPHPDVVARYFDFGSLMLRSDESGAITVKFLRTGWVVEKEREKGKRYWHDVPRVNGSSD